MRPYNDDAGESADGWGAAMAVSVGTRLREARASRGLDLDEAFQHTRINKRFLEALEHDAPPREFPAPVYARAFLEEYARYLGLDPHGLVDEYRRTHGEPEAPPLRLPTPVEEPRGPWLKVTLMVASVAALVAIMVFAVRAGRAPDAEVPDQPVAPPPATATPTATSAPEEPAEEEPEVAGLRLEIRVVDAASWLSVAREGESLIAETVDPGFSRMFRAGPGRQIDVVIGNPQAVRVFLNGKWRSLAGEVVHEASYVFRQGRARVLPAA